MFVKIFQQIKLGKNIVEPEKTCQITLTWRIAVMKITGPYRVFMSSK